VDQTTKEMLKTHLNNHKFILSNVAQKLGTRGSDPAVIEWCMDKLIAIMTEMYIAGRKDQELKETADGN